ncbi:MAG: hypothetical protein KJO29_08365, partial [Bacteroidia bacterium]|nr:hypothetical protein [Bacteroidia bacterium]
QLESELTGLGNRMNDQIVKLQSEKEDREKLLEEIQERSNIVKLDSTMFSDVSKEVRIFLPEIKALRIGYSLFTDFQNGQQELPIVIASWEDPDEEKKEQLRTYLKNSYKLDTLVLLIE